MAFSDPQSVTINAVAQSLPRVSSGVNTGTFQKEDGNVILSLVHGYGRRNRRSVRLQQKKTAADPLLSGVFQDVSMSVTITVDSPKVGFTNAEVKYVVDALTGYLTASSGARVTQLLGGES
jgi:hypothetical protein